MLLNMDKSRSAAVVEFKHVKKVPPSDLDKEARDGLNQIDEKSMLVL